MDPTGGPGTPTDPTGAPAAPASPESATPEPTTPGSTAPAGAHPSTGGGAAAADPVDGSSPASPPGRHPILALLDSVGGVASLVDSSAPTIVFALTYTLGHRHLKAALIAAVTTGAVLAIWRLARRQSVHTVVLGFAGIALAAAVAQLTGRASDYYLVSVVRSMALMLVYAISALVRWPIVGVLVGAAAGRPGGFREDPEQLRAYTRVTWFWVLLFLLRLAVRGPLLLANQFGWLSITDVVMGWPLFALWIALTYVLLRRWLHGSVWQAAHEGIVGRNARSAERSAARRSGARDPRGDAPASGDSRGDR